MKSIAAIQIIMATAIAYTTALGQEPARPGAPTAVQRGAEVFAESCAAAIGTGGAAPVAGKQNAILNLMSLFFNVFKEPVDPIEFFVAVPQEHAFVLCQFMVGAVNWEIMGSSFL